MDITVIDVPEIAAFGVAVAGGYPAALKRGLNCGALISGAVVYRGAGPADFLV
jgi:hypothetical protein